MNEKEKKTGSAENAEEIENKDKTEKDSDVVIPVTIGTAAMNSVDATKTEGDNKQSDDGDDAEGKKKKLLSSLIRAAVAIVAAVILLAITGFSPFALLKGPVESEAIQSNNEGDYVKRDVFAILGFYADEKNSSGETTSRYAVVPMNGQLVSVHFTKRYLESAGAVCDSTYDFVNGKLNTLDAYVTVEGTVGKLSEDASGLLYDWFGLNKDQLVEMKMIADTDDYSTYLSDYVLRVDTVNGYSQTLTIVLGALAALFAFYALFEIISLAIGPFLPKKAKEVDEEVLSVFASDDDEEPKSDDSSDEKSAVKGEDNDYKESDDVEDAKDHEESDDSEEIKDEKKSNEKTDTITDEPEEKE